MTFRGRGFAAHPTTRAMAAGWSVTLAPIGAVGPVGPVGPVGKSYRRAHGLILRIAGGVFIGYGAKLAFDAR